MNMSISSSGSFKNLDGWFARLTRRRNVRDILDTYGMRGVDALANATPRETNKTADSWRYRVRVDKVGYTIEWYNTNIVNGKQIAILIQYGHGTGTGGFVVGRDYINPAMRPIFNQMADDLWKEVTK